MSDLNFVLVLVLNDISNNAGIYLVSYLYLVKHALNKCNISRM